MFNQAFRRLRSGHGSLVETPPRPKRRRLWLIAGAACFFAIGLYFAIGSIWAHRIDDNLSYAPAAAAPPKGSSVIHMAAALIAREVDENAWTVNDPWFAPRAFIDDGANFQAGMMSAIARFSYEILDQMGRSRGSSKADPDLERAAGLLQFPGDVWVFDFRHSAFPTVPSEDQYRSALAALRRYNSRLAQGQAVFERRADAFAATIGRVANDLGSQSAFIDLHLKESRFFLNAQADDIFFKGKGKIYAYYLLLRELSKDFEQVIAEKGLKAVYGQALDTLKEAAAIYPPIVLDGAPKTGIIANHLAIQGYYLVRAVLQLNDVVRVLAI